MNQADSLLYSQRQDKELATLYQWSSSLESQIFRTLQEGRDELRANLKLVLQSSQSDPDGPRAVLDHDLGKWKRSHESDLQILSNEIAQHSSSSMKEQSNGVIMRSLYFPQIRYREQQIGARPALPNTLKWLFDKSSSDGPQAPNFAVWLGETQNSSHLFWFRGLPGSGKSTLMHFLHGSPETKTALQSWNSNFALLTASAFFWLAGSPIQRSLNGLLRSLLHDILLQDSSVLASICHWRRRAISYGVQLLAEWSDAELMGALQDLIVATVTSHRIFFLIDGLDEYDATSVEQRALVDFLKCLAEHPNVKMCVSSRPSPVFRNGFGTCPYLRLENLTRVDIQTYIKAKFEEVPRFRVLQALHSDDCERLLREISQKARAIFLWVYLITSSLTQGLIEGDTVQQLWDRLRIIPSDLKRYYRQIILAIPEEHRSMAATYFGVVVAMKHQVSLFALSFLDNYRNDSIQIEPCRPMEIEELQEKKQSMTLRIESRCRGLLQIIRRKDSGGQPVGGPFFSLGVDYLHRTVRDFLLSDDIKQILEGYSPQPLVPYLFLCQTIVAQMKMTTSNDELHYLASGFMAFAGQLEQVDGCAHMALIDDYFTLVHRHMLRTDQAREIYDSVGARVKAAILFGLSEYAKAKIEASTFDTNGNYASVCPPNFPNVRTPSHLIDDCSKRHDGPGSDGVLDGVIAALLEKGADPNWITRSYVQAGDTYVTEETLWSTFLRKAYSSKKRSATNHASWFRAAQHFVRQGAAATTQSAGTQDCAKKLEYIFPGPDGQQLANELRKRSKPGLRRLLTGFQLSRS